MSINGNFVLSLDFELFWGVRDKRTISNYGENIKGVHQVIPRLLELFHSYNIGATFSTVGFLFFENKADLLSHIPSQLPTYDHLNYSPYLGYFDRIENNAQEDIYHFAPQLIQLIQKYPKHEIGSHTFSHYYCLEKGQTKEQFQADMRMAIEVAQKYNIALTSLVFPRNQFNNEYLKICADLGIICYRGNEQSWLYQAKNAGQENSIRRALRLLDSYLNISGHHGYSDEYMSSQYPINIPASRFLRPYSKRLNFLESMRLNRIKSGMTHAAKNNLTYHLWWHPHNFGKHQNENFLFLEKILEHFEVLRNKYNFQSITMSALASQLLNNNSKI